MSVLVIIFLLGLMISANSEKCPPSEETEPCNCENMGITSNIRIECDEKITDLQALNKSLRSLVGKKQVEMYLNNIKLGTVPSNFFNGIGVKRLSISDCELDSLTEHESLPPLSGLEGSLMDLKIRGSFTEDKMTTKLRLGHLKMLMNLNLNSNSITELDDDWFGSSSSLQYIAIDDNEITKVGDRAFANLDNLQRLSFGGNRFGSLKRSMLPTSPKSLNALELEDNALTTLPEDIFSDMTSLDTVSLRYNGITKLEQKTWEHVWNQLNGIYFADNPLECDSHMTWLFNFRVPRFIDGTCNAPKEMKGKTLKELLHEQKL